MFVVSNKYEYLPVEMDVWFFMGEQKQKNQKKENQHELIKLSYFVKPFYF